MTEIIPPEVSLRYTLRKAGEEMKKLNSCELEIDLFCKGARIDPSVPDKELPAFHRTRAGLGSGLELVLPGPLKDIWVNVPVEESFVHVSPYLLTKANGSFVLLHEPLKISYSVHIPPEPTWYSGKTSKGTLMSRVGVLQGTYLGIYLSNTCHFWYSRPAPLNCGFCTTGKNVGINEERTKDVEDVVEVCQAAKRESGVTFVHFNTGYHNQGKELDLIGPYVKAVKEKVGLLVGVQATPTKELWKYDWLIDLGVDHFSFCYEFQNPSFFEMFCPGKAEHIGQEVFFRALEYTAAKLGKGTCSGEIIAGVEPVSDTLRAIDYITSVGAFPTVCIFRPLIGADMERFHPPDFDDMVVVMRHMVEACLKHKLPIGIAPNIQVSLIVQPDDALYLLPDTWQTRLYSSRLRLLKLLAKPHFARKLRPRRLTGRADQRQHLF